MTYWRELPLAHQSLAHYRHVHLPWGRQSRARHGALADRNKDARGYEGWLHFEPYFCCAERGWRHIEAREVSIIRVMGAHEEALVQVSRTNSRKERRILQPTFLPVRGENFNNDCSTDIAYSTLFLSYDGLSCLIV